MSPPQRIEEVDFHRAKWQAAGWGLLGIGFAVWLGFDHNYFIVKLAIAVSAPFYAGWHFAEFIYGWIWLSDQLMDAEREERRRLGEQVNP